MTAPNERVSSAPSREDAGRQGVSERQVRGSALLVLGRVLGLLIAMATQVVMVRALTKADFGAFEYAITLAGSARILLSLGQGRLLSRFMASYDEQGDYPRMFGAMLLTVGTIAATSIPFIVALYIWPQQLIGAAVSGDRPLNLVLILVFLSPLEALDQVFVSLFAVFTKPSAIFFRKYLLSPLLRLVAVVALAVTGAGVYFLAVGYLVASAAGILLYCFLFYAALRDRGHLAHFRLRHIVFPFRAVFEFSIPLITGELSLLSLKLGGVVVLGAYQSVVDVANYRVVFGTARLNTAITTSFATLFLPVIARLHTRGDAQELRRNYWHTASFVAVFTYPIYAMTGPLAEATTVTLFDERYAGSARILAVLSLGYFVNIALGFNTYALQVCGRIRWLVGVNVLVAVGNIALCVALVPRYGAMGAAAANCIALVGQNLLNQLKLMGSIGTGFLDRSCWLCYGVMIACSVVLWGLQRALHPGILLSLVLAAMASAVVLAAGRRALQLATTFPELRRIPLLGALAR